MLIPVVDEQDNIVAYKQREELVAGDVCRVTGLIVVDGNNNMLITRRALTKKKSPGKRTIAVSGTVEKGETYEDNIVKETKEELGMKLGEHQEILHVRSGSKKDHFVKIFITQMPADTSFVFDPEETIDSRRISFDELSAWILQSPDDFVSLLVNFWEELKTHILSLGGQNHSHGQ